MVRKVPAACLRKCLHVHGIKFQRLLQWSQLLGSKRGTWNLDLGFVCGVCVEREREREREREIQRERERERPLHKGRSSNGGVRQQHFA